MTTLGFLLLLLAVFVAMALAGIPGGGLVVIAGFVWWSWNWGTP
jgi:hypothetical protein